MPRPWWCLEPPLAVLLLPALITFLPFLLPEEEEEAEALLVEPPPLPLPLTPPLVRLEDRGCEFAYTLTVCWDRAGVPGRFEPRVERTRRAARFSRTITVFFKFFSILLCMPNSNISISHESCECQVSG